MKTKKAAQLKKKKLPNWCPINVWSTYGNNDPCV